MNVEETDELGDDELDDEHEVFETQEILDAVGNLDEVRRIVSDLGPDRPPEVRSQLLKLHTLTVDVLSSGGSKDEARRVIAQAFELQGDVGDAIEHLQRIFEVLRSLVGHVVEVRGLQASDMQASDSERSEP